MKKFILAILLFLSPFSLLYSQWTAQLLPSCRIRLLKKVNGVLFAYGVNNTNLTGKLYSSTNGGQSWQVADSTTLKFRYANDITYDSTNEVYIICATAQSGIITSTDGFNWTVKSNFWSGDGITFLHDTVFVSLPGTGVGYSVDGGQSFTASNSGLIYPFYVHSINRFGDTLYVSDQIISLFSSFNNAFSWTNCSNGLNSFVNRLFYHQGNYYAGLYINKVVKKINGNWFPFALNLPSTQNINDLADKGDTLFCGGDTIGVWINTDSTWHNFSCGLPASITVTKLYRNGNYLFAGTDNGLWKINAANGCSGVGLSEIIPENNYDRIPGLISNTFQLFNPSNTVIKLNLFDISGRLLKEFSGQSPYSVNEINPGIYFITVYYKTAKPKTTKVIIQ